MKKINDQGTINPYTVSPDELVDGDRIGYKIVGVIKNGFWEAYIGLTDWTDEYTLAHGERLRDSGVANYLIDAPSRGGLKYYNGSRME